MRCVGWNWRPGVTPSVWCDNWSRMATECSTVEEKKGLASPLLLVTLPMMSREREKGLVALKTRMSREKGDYCCHETDRELLWLSRQRSTLEGPEGPMTYSIIIIVEMIYSGHVSDYSNRKWIMGWHSSEQLGRERLDQWKGKGKEEEEEEVDGVWEVVQIFTLLTHPSDQGGRDLGKASQASLPWDQNRSKSTIDLDGTVDEPPFYYDHPWQRKYSLDIISVTE